MPSLRLFIDFMASYLTPSLLGLAIVWWFIINDKSMTRLSYWYYFFGVLIIMTLMALTKSLLIIFMGTTIIESVDKSAIMNLILPICYSIIFCKLLKAKHSLPSD